MSSGCPAPEGRVTGTVRILVVGDIRLYREGLAALLDRDQRFTVVGSASHPDGLVETITTTQADVLLIDMAMPSALEAVRAICKISPELKVVALAMPETEKDVCACAEAGVAGFVPRYGSFEDLIGALECLERGELHCSARAAATLLRRVTTLATEQPRTSGATRLTPREVEVLELMDQGLSNKEIASSLGIEVATAKNHVHNILEKMQVHRRGEAVARMRRRPRAPRQTLARSSKR